MTSAGQDSLQQQHTSQAIAARIDAATDHTYVGDAVLGAVDGTVTTFAIVCGVAGAGYSTGVALVLGLANVVADGFSMAVSNYLKARADAQVVERFRALEEMHIDEIPEGEREEIRQIFAGKGFDGDMLDHIVDVITKDRKRWVDTMLTEEWGLQIESPSATKAALATFFAFLVAGLVPLLPLLLLAGTIGPAETFTASALATAVAFLAIGMIRGRIVGRPIVASGLETLLIGGVAAGLAYAVGLWMKDLVGG